MGFCLKRTKFQKRSTPTLEGGEGRPYYIHAASAGITKYLQIMGQRGGRMRHTCRSVFTLLTFRRCLPLLRLEDAPVRPSRSFLHGEKNVSNIYIKQHRCSDKSDIVTHTHTNNFNKWEPHWPGMAGCIRLQSLVGHATVPQLGSGCKHPQPC